MVGPQLPSKEEFINADARYARACERRAQAYAALNRGDRWGESRRFAGRSAGLRLDRIARANAACNRAYDAAEKRWDRLQRKAGSNSAPEVPTEVLRR